MNFSFLLETLSLFIVLCGLVWSLCFSCCKPPPQRVLYGASGIDPASAEFRKVSRLHVAISELYALHESGYLSGSNSLMLKQWSAQCLCLSWRRQNQKEKKGNKKPRVMTSIIMWVTTELCRVVQCDVIYRICPIHRDRNPANEDAFLKHSSPGTRLLRGSTNRKHSSCPAIPPFDSKDVLKIK